MLRIIKNFITSAISFIARYKMVVVLSVALPFPSADPCKPDLIPASAGSLICRTYVLTDKTEAVVDLSILLFRKIHIRYK